MSEHLRANTATISGVGILPVLTKWLAIRLDSHLRPYPTPTLTTHPAVRLSHPALPRAHKIRPEPLGLLFLLVPT